MIAKFTAGVGAESRMFHNGVMLEQLGQWLENLEPYTSYRASLGFVLGAVFVYTVIEAVISLRAFFHILRGLDDLARQRRLFDAARLAVSPDLDLSGLPGRQSRPGSALRLMVVNAALRAVSLDGLRRCAPELALIALLTPACIAAYWYVFTA